MSAAEAKSLSSSWSRHENEPLRMRRTCSRRSRACWRSRWWHTTWNRPRHCGRRS